MAACLLLPIAWICLYLGFFKQGKHKTLGRHGFFVLRIRACGLMSNFRLLSENGVRSLWAVLLPTFPRCILECYLSPTSTSSDMWIKHCRESAHSRKSHQSANTRHTCRVVVHTHTQHIHGHEGRWVLTKTHKESQRVKEREREGSLPSYITYGSKLRHF